MERVTSSRRIYDGRVINLRIDTVVLRDGSKTQREIVEHPGAVAIVPQLDKGDVVLVRQFRKSVEDELFEIPAGTLKKDEAPRACARRELLEETGYRARRLVRLASFYLAPGYSTELLHAYLAFGLTPGVGSPEADESIDVIKIPFEDALKWIDRGKIKDAKSISALLLTSRILTRDLQS